MTMEKIRSWPYLVMRYMSGGTLGDLIGDGQAMVFGGDRPSYRKTGWHRRWTKRMRKALFIAI